MALMDEVQLHFKAGNGGNGVVRWRQEKFKPKGGPAGGDGGRGGDVIAKATSNISALEYFRHQKKFSAENGGHGGSSSMEGKNGEDLVLEFPVGTILKNQETGEIVEMMEVGQTATLLRGGRGGLGNERFKSSTNTTPYEQTDGKPGAAANFDIELQMIAEAGFIGIPSAGKSTLINALTNTKSKVAAYHFTTLDPHLGKFNEFILADIPGIIEGASEGKGLGYKFLRHIKRTKVLFHCISLEYDNITELYDTIRTELVTFDPEMAEKREAIILTKTDMVDSETLEKRITEIKSHTNASEIYSVSAYDDDSIKSLGDNLVKILREK